MLEPATFRRSRALIMLALLVPCLLITLVAIIAYRAERQLAESFQWVEHTIRVERGVQLLLALLVDVESGQRGFQLTGRDSYLKDYRAALQSLPDEIEALRAL